MKKQRIGDSRAIRVLFRSVGIVIAIALSIGALKFISNRQGFSGFISFLFAVFIFLYVLIKKKPTVRAWLSLWGLLLLALLILGFLEVGDWF
jgi:hypothetical protein